MRRIALSIALLALIVSVNTVQSVQQKDYAVSSYGKISYKEDTHKFMWGAVVSDTAWGADYPGCYFGENQVKILATSGATAVRIMLDKNSWSGDKDYIKQLVDWCHNEGLDVLLDLTRDSSMNPFEAPEKQQVIESSSMRTAWIDWGKEVIAYCNPDAIGLMNEPYYPDFAYYFDNFVVPSIGAYRAVDPNVIIFVMGLSPTDIGGFAAGGYGDSLLADDKVIFEWHIYFTYPMSLSDTSQIWYNTCTSYGEGNLADAKNYLQQYLAWKFSGFPLTKINVAELGCASMTEDVPSQPHWDVFMQDFYDYVAENELNGLFQYAVSTKYYRMFDYTTDYTTLTPYGELWCQNCPK